MALIISAFMSAPWPTLVGLSLALGGVAIGGLAYGAVVVVRARRQTEYQPVWDDWVWYVALPWACYLVLALAAVWLGGGGEVTPFMIGASALGLLFIGIRNAWDTVTHVVISAAAKAAGNTD